ncbi:hypothetical protein [Microtetraspora glauca]|uniref:Flavin reductase like domain-containing protein n=1 Tax=Microtetraspora glauca TaxID=1996 RepID=A0ABV3GA77_MICGL
MDKFLAEELGRVGTDILQPFTRLDAPQALPALECKIHRVREVSGGQLVAAEFVHQVVHILVPGELIRRAAAVGLSEAATRLMRHFRR